MVIKKFYKNAPKGTLTKEEKENKTFFKEFNDFNQDMYDTFFNE